MFSNAYKTLILSRVCLRISLKEIYSRPKLSSERTVRLIPQIYHAPLPASSYQRKNLNNKEAHLTLSVGIAKVPVDVELSRGVQVSTAVDLSAMVCLPEGQVRGKRESTYPVKASKAPVLRSR